jgi:hypothetical protein
MIYTLYMRFDKSCKVKYPIYFLQLLSDVASVRKLMTQRTKVVVWQFTRERWDM